MSVAVLSLLGLLIVIVISCLLPKINPGLLALLVALGIGTGLADLSIKTILAGFPTEIFLLLVIMCLVFGVAMQNGTLPAITDRLVAVIKGKILLLPILFFFLSFLLSALGPGNIAAVALVASLAMVLSHQYKISPLLTAIMICTGANAGALSPFAPTGVIAAKLMAEIGLETTSLSWTVFAASAVLQGLTALGAYSIFLLRRYNRQQNHHFEIREVREQSINKNTSKMPFDLQQWLTIAGILTLIAGVIFFKVPLIVMALSVLICFAFLNLGDPEKVLHDLPWSTILMITGISILIGLMEKTGGLDLATTMIAKFTAPELINAVLAFITGIVSAFSSSSGVVMPAFIPLIPGLAEKMQIDNTVNMVISVAVGSHMVDVSPLSTLGALALAAMVDQKQRQRVFKLLLIWGMSMAFVGAGIALLILDSGLIS